MPIHAISIYHHIGMILVLLATAIRQENYPNRKGRGKIVTKFADNMILYIKNPKISIEKLLKLINEFRKVEGQKINMQKSIAFLYIKNDQKKQ